ncbi:MAG: hypothetical protein VW878_06975 [Candidatus Poseidoniales archaeon]
MEQSIDLEQGQPEFNADELDSLQVGEELLEQEQEMLAGKFKDAEELEKAYIELQRKLGSKDEPQETEEVRDDETSAEEVEEYTTEQWINEAAQEWNENGTLSEETLSQISEMDPADLANAFMGMQNTAEDLSEADTNAIKAVAGGEEGYAQMIEWATNSMPEAYTNSFNQLVATGDAYSIQLAVAGMRAAYEQQNGYEGRMLTGEAADSRPDAFRSQAEVIQAMSDPRYDSDPAYRNDVFAKLERSNIDF